MTLPCGIAPLSLQKLRTLKESRGVLRRWQDTHAASKRVVMFGMPNKCHASSVLR